MVLPLVPIIAGALIASSLVSTAGNIYTTNKTTRAYDEVYNYTNAFYTGANLENERFFSDYLRSHHIGNRTIRYPYRSGYNFDLSKVMSANAGLTANSLNRFNSYIQGGSNIARNVSVARLYNPGYVAGKPKFDIMYG